MDKFTNFIKAQLDKPTAWIGLIGLVLQFLNLQSVMFFLFLALMFLPEARFTDTFKEWNTKIKDLDL